MSDKAGSSAHTVRARLAFRDGDETAGSFLQRRLANAALFALTFSLGFAVLRVSVALAVGSREQLTETSLQLHLLSAISMAALWIYCRGPQRSERRLIVADVVCMSLAGASLAVMGAFIPFVMRPDNVVVLILSLVMTARAIYVPSTARRTLLLASIVAVPYLAMVSYAVRSMPPELAALTTAVVGASSLEGIYRVTLAYAASWWVVATAVCVSASRVVYGLRQEVRKVKRLGQYQLGEELGAGGMGIVYRAHHALLQRPTAIKLLRPDTIGERSLERFEREVRQTARLSHPNTITIFDYGHTPEGLFYYAMELLDGVTLDRVVDATGPMPPGRALHILRQVAGSLAEAHAMGLAHRDIKPDNIMLCELGGVPDTVKVLDFGLVKEVARDGDRRLTGTNVVVGTPQYMAPEAITAPEATDARADVYALAATGYLLLTGRDVFEAESVVELCSHHLHTAPTPPSEIYPGVPPDLERVLLHALEKKPDARPRDGRALGALLASCQAAGDWDEERAQEWWRQHGEMLARPGGVSTHAPTLLASSIDSGIGETLNVVAD